MKTNAKRQEAFDTAYASLCAHMRDDTMTMYALMITSNERGDTVRSAGRRLSAAAWWKSADIQMTSTMSGEPAVMRGSEN